MSIETIVRKNGCRYRAVVRIGRKKVSKTFERKIDAKAWEAEVRSLGEATERKSTPETQSITLNQLNDRFLSEYGSIYNSPGTLINHHSIYTNYLKAELGDVLITDLTSERIEKYLNHLRRDREKSHGRVNRVRQLLHTVLNRAVSWNLLDTNPVSKIEKLPEKDFYAPDTIRFLTKEDSNTLLRWLEVHNSWLYPKVVLLLHTGIRYGEAAALRVQDVRLTHGNPHLLICRSRCRHTGKFGPPKSKRSRVIPLSPGLTAFIQKLIEGKKAEDPVLWRDWNEGRWPTKSYDHFCQAIKETGVSSITLHDLRHCYAVRFLENGGHVYVLKELLGHRDIKTTMRYSHFSPAMAEQARGIVDFEKSKPRLTVLNGGLL
jgi:integrase